MLSINVITSKIFELRYDHGMSILYQPGRLAKRERRRFNRAQTFIVRRSKNQMDPEASLNQEKGLKRSKTSFQFKAKDPPLVKSQLFTADDEGCGSVPLKMQKTSPNGHSDSGVILQNWMTTTPLSSNGHSPTEGEPDNRSKHTHPELQSKKRKKDIETSSPSSKKFKPNFHTPEKSPSSARISNEKGNVTTEFKSFKFSRPESAPTAQPASPKKEASPPNEVSPKKEAASAPKKELDSPLQKETPSPAQSKENSKISNDLPSQSPQKKSTFGSNRDPSLGTTNIPTTPTEKVTTFIPRQLQTNAPKNSLFRDTPPRKLSSQHSNATDSESAQHSSTKKEKPASTQPKLTPEKNNLPLYGPNAPKPSAFATTKRQNSQNVTLPKISSSSNRSDKVDKPNGTSEPVEPTPSKSLQLYQKTYIIEETNLVARSKDLPLRLNQEERDLLGLLEAALDVSEYTDKVDVAINQSSRNNLMKTQIKEVINLIVGLYVAQNNVKGRKLVLEQGTKGQQIFIQKVFEIGRRYKIMNSDKMRTTHGKLLFLMQDASSREDLKVRIEIKTVSAFVHSKQASKILNDPDLVVATRCVESSDLDDLKEQSKLKSDAIARLVEKFETPLFTKDDLHVVLDSVSDSNAYTLSHRHPIDRIIDYLHGFFNPTHPTEQKYSLQITTHANGSKLSHNHTTQFNFVHQSLLLWREIQHNMFKLWKAADKDLLDQKEYRLADTGQGLNRVQPANTVGQIMSTILHNVKTKVKNSWVGLSVVHLGDKDVPNALVFINKYCQVPYILGPIVTTLDRIRSMSESDPAVKQFVNQFGSVKQAQTAILCDFFKHGFDGSGDSGGSCIDGRLTSAWNWCSRIERKPFYPLFLLTGFLGFDGSFRR